MGLQRYREKRDFQKTKEPRGKRRQRAGFSYVIQKHAASHLHYDFRLELDGVLLSWAVPKGPSLDPATKRLAMQTEDHPVEYGSFEGTIPKGEYGGGTVMVWDQGTWEPEGDARDQYAKGRLSFELHGKKLKGSWHLVRTKARDQGDKRSWLLFKGTDTGARPGDGAIVEEKPNSAKTGRTLEQIAADAGAVWHSNRKASRANGHDASSRMRKPVAPARATRRRTTTKVSERARGRLLPRAELARVAGAKRKALPRAIEPALATLVSEAPSGDDWLQELKFDGYRLLIRVDDGKVTIWSRNGKDWNERIPVLARAFGELDIESAVFDGEAVALNEDGISNFQLLQNSLGDEQAAEKIVYYAFDLLYANGYDLRTAPLEGRKTLLKKLLGAVPEQSQIRLSDHVLGSGAEFFERACGLGLEGIVAKRRDSTYSAGRTREWLKVKCLNRQEFVIGGYTEPSGSRGHLGALLLGDYAGKKLIYRGKVGTGFTRKTLKELHEQLVDLERKTPPFQQPPRGPDARGVHWVKPVLIAEVDFTCLTEEGLMRHPTFRGLRTDKSAHEVVLERPASTPAAETETTDRPRAPRAGARSTFRLTNPERVLYREQGITKNELAEYYAAVGEWMLPHVADRPLTLVRCPEGYDKQCFFQKHAKESLPDGVRPIPIADKDGQAQYTAIDDVVGLLGLVQMGVLEIHTWGAHADNPEKPDLLVFDLDPDPELSWAKVVDAAKLLRARLEALDLQSFVKTTGGKGLHVCVPVARRLDWDRAKEFCRRFSERIVREDPDHYVATMSKARRKGKIFIDFFRNSRGATFIAPYSTRAPERGLPWPCHSPGTSSRPSYCPTASTSATCRNACKD